jgi:hypothetical protein
MASTQLHLQSFEQQAVYAGGVYHKDQRYRVSVRCRNKCHQRSFSYGQRRTQEQACALAQQAQRQLSDELQLTKVIPADSEALRQYVAGLIDSDGYMGMHNNSTRIGITQSCSNGIPLVLQFVQSLYLGTELENRSPRNSATRVRWQLVWYGQDALRLIARVRPYLQLKRNQAEMLLLRQEWVESNILSAFLDAQVRLRLHNSHQKDYYRKLTCTTVLLSWQWIAGFFDGDGSVRIQQVPRGHLLEASIRQCININILLAIQRFADCSGSIQEDGTKLVYNSYNAVKFLQHIAPFVVQKKDQVDLCLQLFDRPASEFGKKRSAEQLQAVSTAVLTLKKLKRK